ncbi:hypothetical protein QBC36DRAFT_382524 [Triangularia setosa]|uniref:Uncharacterized protein n=1 Tax=Triangularia setosa TaxID=2587417 RepID=A0AAN6VY17_9PEZI|nr:hypothetical protein QBC36DRAFT_382524 [Podospora setosa]
MGEEEAIARWKEKEEKEFQRRLRTTLTGSGLNDESIEAIIEGEKVHKNTVVHPPYPETDVEFLKEAWAEEDGDVSSRSDEQTSSKSSKDFERRLKKQLGRLGLDEEAIQATLKKERLKKQEESSQPESLRPTYTRFSLPYLDAETLVFFFNNRLGI